MASKKRAYDRSIDLYTGPTGTPPSTLYGLALPARLVLSSEFTSTGIGGFQPAGYFTMDAYALYFPIVAVFFTEPYWIYFSTATQIASVSGAAPDYYVLSADYFALPGGGNYQRAWVVPLPLP